MSEAVNAITEELASDQSPVLEGTAVESETQEAIKPPEVSPKDERVSSKIELLIRREQAAIQKERQAKEQMLQAQDTLNKIKEFEEARTNPKKALELLGLNYDELTKSLLADGTIPPEVEIKKLKDELGAFKQSQEEKERRLAEDQKLQAQKQETQAIENFKKEIEQFLNDNTSRYELTLFDGHASEVFDLIDAHYERTRDPETGIGKVMKIAEAADKIEEYYEKRELEKKKLAKLQTLWGAVPKTAISEITKQASSKSQKPETLTNNMSASPSKLQSRLPEDKRVEQIVANFIKTKRG